MKSVLSLALAAFSLSSTVALAAPTRVPCGPADYQYIQQALAQGRVLEGAEKKAALLSVLSQEMGPVCKQVIPDGPVAGISGTRYTKYEISTGSSAFELSISLSRVTDPGFKVSIK